MSLSTYAKTVPGKPAVIMNGSGQVLTYGQLNDESIRLAKVLREAGLEPRDRVAILMSNDPRFLTAYWAARRIGLNFVPINWHLPTPEAAYILEDSGAKALITNAVSGEVAVELRRTTPSLRVALAVDADLEGFDDLEKAMAAQTSDPLDNEIRGEFMMYTSGTTGRPKGAMRPFTGGDPFEPDPLSAMVQSSFGLNGETVFLNPGAPLYHGAPLAPSIAVNLLGGTNVVMERFDAEAALAAIERHRVTASSWVPTMFVRMLRLPEETRKRYDLTSQRFATHGGAPCPMWVKEQMLEWWGPILVEYFGATDGGPATMITSEEWLAHPGSVGRSSAGKLHILGEDGEELPPGVPGVVYAENAHPVAYHNDAQKTADAHSKEGWVTVGDMGYLDEEGYLYLTDRKHNMIISGGVNIYPQEVENILLENPKVSDVAVIGVPNEEFGEEVKAVVCVSDGVTPGSELADDLMKFCYERIAHYKCPRSVDFVDELPRDPSGKLYKRLLKDKYWEGHHSRVI